MEREKRLNFEMNELCGEQKDEINFNSARTIKKRQVLHKVVHCYFLWEMGEGTFR